MKARAVTSRTRPGPPAAPTAAQHNRVLRAAERRALDLEDRLVEILVPVLERAGEVAAANFEARAQRHLRTTGITQTFPLVASANVKAASTMVAVKPTPAQAATLAEPDGDPPENLHVTLAYLGETEGDLSEIGDVLARVPGAHAPLEGTVGGVGSFADSGHGHPAILLPSVPGLLELRHDVTVALQAAGLDWSRGYGWLPHITTAYRPDGPQPPPIDQAGAPLNFDDLWIVRGDVETIQLPLTGVAPVTASADPGLLEAIAEVARRYEPDPPDYGSAWWSEAEATVYWVCADWTTNDEIDAATEAWLEIPEVEQVDACGECPGPTGGDWVLAYARGSGASLEAASPPLQPPYCLPADLRTKTDPVRTAVAQTVMQAGVEGAGLSFDITNPLAGKVLAQSGSQIVGISKTTQLDVMKTIRYAYDQGLSIPDTAKAIRAAMAESAPWRARLIARTELAGAVNGASLAATKIVEQASQADPSFRGYTKIWMTAPGARYPRHEDYEGLDGQEVALDEPFDVGGADLMFPGDPDGPPEEVCNCRCALRYSDGAQPASAPDVTAGAHECLLAGGEEVSLETLEVYRSMVAAGGPADWVPPAPEEILPTECEAPRLPGASTTGLPASTPGPIPGPLPGDAISVGAGPPLPPEMIAQIQRLGLDHWPPAKGAASLRILGDAKDTEELYYNEATGRWADARASSHQQILDEHFVGKTPPPPGAQLHAYFTAGGGASGKSSLRFELDGRQLSTDELAARPDTILVDPDRVKTMISEFGEIVDSGDAYAASAVHEESSWVAKEIVREARARGYNVVLDTTGSSGGFLDKIASFKEAGYETQVSMVSVPTNTAIKRAMLRGDKSGRYVAIQALKDAHARASRQLAAWMESEDVDRWTLLDNSGPKAELVARGGGGATDAVRDQRALDDILGKATESVPARTDAPLAVQDGPPLPSVDALPVSSDAYVAGLQAEQRRLGKQVADAKFRLKTETDADRRTTLEARMAAWQKRRDELGELISTPDPNAELRRLTKQIANARFEIRNGRGSVRLEARLKALDARREQLRKLLAGDLKDEIAAEAKARRAEERVAEEAVATQTPKAPEAPPEAGPTKPGEYVNEGYDPRHALANSPYWLREQIPGPGPANFVRIPSRPYKGGSSREYEMGESIAFLDESGSGVVIRMELRPGEDAIAQSLARAVQRQFAQAWGKTPDWMQGRLQEVVVARDHNPDDAYWRTVYKGFSNSAASAGNGVITFWGGTPINSSAGVFDHEMGHIVGVGGGPLKDAQWKAAQTKDMATSARYAGIDDPARRVYGDRDVGHQWMLGARAVSDYGANSINEDWAESIRLYLRDQREGSIGTFRKIDGFVRPVRFADVWPARARLIERWLRDPAESG